MKIHPRHRKVAAWLALVLVAGLVWLGLRVERSLGEADRQPIAHRIARGRLKVEIQATGKVFPESRLDVKPPIAGRIEKIEVEEGEQVKVGQVLAYMSSTDRAALLDLARARGSEEHMKLLDVFRPTPIVAPITGTVISRIVHPGQTVGTGDVAFILSDRPIIIAEVDETDMALVKVGQPVTISLDAYPDQTMTGKVMQIAYESRTVTNVTVYEVKILPDDVPDFMRSGMTTSVKFLVADKDDALLVPLHVVKEKHGETFVLMPSPDDRRFFKPEGSGGWQDFLSRFGLGQGEPEAIKRKIVLGLGDGMRAEVLDGLREGDLVLEIPKPSPPVETEPATPSTSPLVPASGEHASSE